MEVLVTIYHLKRTPAELWSPGFHSTILQLFLMKLSISMLESFFNAGNKLRGISGPNETNFLLEKL